MFWDKGLVMDDDGFSIAFDPVLIFAFRISSAFNAPSRLVSKVYSLHEGEAWMSRVQFFGSDPIPTTWPMYRVNNPSA
jgi:hypothetical protein